MAAPNLKGGITEYFSPGDRLTMTAGGTITGGDVVALNGNRQVIVAPTGSAAIIGVAGYNAVSGEKVTVFLEGVVPVVASAAVAAGDIVDVGTTAGRVRPIAAGGFAQKVGRALEAISLGATGRIKLTL